MFSKSCSSLTTSTTTDPSSLVFTLAERVESLERAFIKSKSTPFETAPLDVQQVVTEVIQALDVVEPDFERRLRHALEVALRKQHRVVSVEELCFLEKEVEVEDRPSVSKSSKRKLTEEEREERARLAQKAKEKREQEEAERKKQILEKKQMAEQDRLVKKMMEEEARAEKKRLLEEAKAKREQLREEQARLKQEQREALARLKEKRPVEEKGSHQKKSKKSKSPIQEEDEETVLFVQSNPVSSSRSSSSSSSTPPVTRTVVKSKPAAKELPPAFSSFSSSVNESEHEWEESELDDESFREGQESEAEGEYDVEASIWELPSFEGMTWEEWSKDEEGEDTSSYTYTSISGFEDYLYRRDGAEKKIVYANCEGGVHQPDTLAVGHYSSTEGGSTQVHFHPNYSWLVSVNHGEL
jgi:hypothetical protein